MRITKMYLPLLAALCGLFFAEPVNAKEGDIWVVDPEIGARVKLHTVPSTTVGSAWNNKGPFTELAWPEVLADDAEWIHVSAPRSVGGVITGYVHKSGVLNTSTTPEDPKTDPLPIVYQFFSPVTIHRKDDMIYFQFGSLCEIAYLSDLEQIGEQPENLLDYTKRIRKQATEADLSGCTNLGD